MTYWEKGLPQRRQGRQEGVGQGLSEAMVPGAGCRPLPQLVREPEALSAAMLPTGGHASEHRQQSSLMVHTWVSRRLQFRKQKTRPELKEPWRARFLLMEGCGFCLSLWRPCPLKNWFLLPWGPKRKMSLGFRAHPMKRGLPEILQPTSGVSVLQPRLPDLLRCSVAADVLSRTASVVFIPVSS